MKIRIALLTLEKENMISFLQADQDVFAWKHEDMPRITGRSYSIVSMSTQNANLYSKNGEYLHKNTTRL